MKSYYIAIDVALSGNTVSSNPALISSEQITWSAIITAPRGAWKETVVVTVEEDCEGPLVNVVKVTTEEGATGDTSVAVNLYKVYMPIILRSWAQFAYHAIEGGDNENATVCQNWIT